MRYEYKCESCNKDYVEIREVTDPQFFTFCGCGTEYTLMAEKEHE